MNLEATCSLKGTERIKGTVRSEKSPQSQPVLPWPLTQSSHDRKQWGCLATRSQGSTCPKGTHHPPGAAHRSSSARAFCRNWNFLLSCSSLKAERERNPAGGRRGAQGLPKRCPAGPAGSRAHPSPWPGGRTCPAGSSPLCFSCPWRRSWGLLSLTGSDLKKQRSERSPGSLPASRDNPATRVAPSAPQPPAPFHLPTDHTTNPIPAPAAPRAHSAVPSCPAPPAPLPLPLSSHLHLRKGAPHCFTTAVGLTQSRERGRMAECVPRELPGFCFRPFRTS